MKINKHGFTILELLIVIVVIGILAGIVLTAFGNIQDRAEVTRIRVAANQYAKALFNYKTDFSDYPDPTQLADNGGEDRVCLGNNYVDSRCGSSNAWVNESDEFNTLLEPYFGSPADLRATTFDVNLGSPIEIRGVWYQYLREISGITLDGSPATIPSIAYIIPESSADCTAGTPLNTADFTNWTTATTQKYVLTTGKYTYCVVQLP